MPTRKEKDTTCYKYLAVVLVVHIWLLNLSHIFGCQTCHTYFVGWVVNMLNIVLGVETFLSCQWAPTRTWQNQGD
jgi:hypothetical protein